MDKMEDSKNQNITAAIEAVLFAYGEPLGIKKIAKLLKTSEEKVKGGLDELAKDLEQENRGLKLVLNGSEVQLATKPEFISFLENFIKEEFKENLTPASLETLSLIAYFGPISRAQIDYYRGVNSSFILRSLLLRGLVDRRPDPQKSNVYLYETSFDLLKYLGISKVEELPEYEKFRTMKDEL